MQAAHCLNCERPESLGGRDEKTTKKAACNTTMSVKDKCMELVYEFQICFGEGSKRKKYKIL